jgi:hypothetical protein
VRDTDSTLTELSDVTSIKGKVTVLRQGLFVATRIRYRLHPTDACKEGDSTRWTIGEKDAWVDYRHRHHGHKQGNGPSHPSIVNHHRYKHYSHWSSVVGHYSHHGHYTQRHSSSRPATWGSSWLSASVNPIDNIAYLLRAWRAISLRIWGDWIPFSPFPSLPFLPLSPFPSLWHLRVQYELMPLPSSWASCAPALVPRDLRHLLPVEISGS